ncbi:acyltransferase [Mycolicibacterium sp. P9-64]|uniref:acyltransferase family protein n=1 Tax=Mycolicibacterium sp. P9-64 TaxID=2024612 RepID=UPI0011EFC094|nr:acyltransferase [Mycolicibacterium sp. P9-64]KAA0081872.1 acyltransferase [Mycolicibacterium sp. P9-64]
MRSGDIKALTGLRIVAALWVVLFHFRPLLWQAAPDFASALAPVLDCGAQGVDLFFILSGFVLTWNYMDKMGRSWSTRETLRFLWLRLARVWPVYLVTLHLAALWIIFTLNVGHVPSENVGTLNAISYVRQLFLVQLWFEPFFDGTSWDGPAWSISAEWLAYLMFGALILVIFRIARATRARSLLWLALAASLPPVLLLLASGQFYTPWSWLPRIVMQFTAGALACAAVRRLHPSERTRAAAGYLSVLLIGAIVGTLYLFSAHPLATVRDASGLVDVLFVPLIIALAIGSGTLPWVLSTRVAVYLGQISFSLYMVHELVHTAWIWATEQFGLVLAGTSGKFTVVGLIALAVVLAAGLYHVVEEPARRWMRRMVDVREVPMSSRDDPPFDQGTAKLQNIDRTLGPDTPNVSARAG